jgi:hypothetical protein
VEVVHFLVHIQKNAPWLCVALAFIHSGKEVLLTELFTYITWSYVFGCSFLNCMTARDTSQTTLTSMNWEHFITHSWRSQASKFSRAFVWNSMQYYEMLHFVTRSNTTAFVSSCSNAVDMCLLCFTLSTLLCCIVLWYYMCIPSADNAGLCNIRIIIRILCFFLCSV